MKHWTRARCFTDTDYDPPTLIIGKSSLAPLLLQLMSRLVATFAAIHSFIHFFKSGSMAHKNTCK